MRLTVLAAAALALTLPVAAQAGNFDGIYGGVQVGGAFTSFDQTVTSPVYNGGSLENNSLSATGAVGGVFVGYGYVLPYNLFIAGEFDATFGDRDFSYTITDPTNPYKTKLTTGTEWALSVRPGYIVSDTALIYGLLGFERTPIKSSSSDSSEVTFDKTQTSFRLGGGAEISISGPLTLRLDYTHTFIDKIMISDNFGNATSISPSEDKFKAGIAYHF
ncbi:MAG: outer membrane beta-barrel protein [Azospirillaceae bacterium]|nr:outer membrane beta-barrel protein [Azospirillaceae bacterium]